MFSLQKRKNINRKIHRGKILQNVVRETGLSIERITRRAGYKRGTYYLHIKQPQLAPSILFKYGRALNYDFSKDIPELTEFLTGEPDNIYSKDVANIEEAIRQRDEWKDKYYELLEKYLHLIDDNRNRQL